MESEDVGALQGVRDQGTAVTIAALAAVAVGPQEVPDSQHKPFVVVPDGYGVKPLDHLERLNPDRIGAKVAFNDVESLIRYVERFKPEGALAIFASPDPQNPIVLVVLDYHQGEDPSFCTHKARLLFLTTKEWQEWVNASGRPMDQVAFARFVETHLPDIVEPPGAHLLEVVRTLEAKKKVNFRSEVRLDNGERQFVYEEDIKSAAGSGTQKGTLQVPERFTLGLRIWKGSDARWQVEALLRFRISDEGRLQLWFDLERPDDVIEAAFKRTIADLKAKWPEQFFLGTVEG
jgi:uncharacterized protein YfdQ (DUF2303 family)